MMQPTSHHARMTQSTSRRTQSDATTHMLAKNMVPFVRLFAKSLAREESGGCNYRIVIAQKKHLDDFLRGRIIGRLECGRTQLEVSEELGIVQSVISRL
ncbi:transposable element Tcb1 transposase [Trichonephila clavipes]|nr:transposable element Tcb1 transposase [Trichonephila clavipes]